MASNFVETQSPATNVSTVQIVQLIHSENQRNASNTKAVAVVVPVPVVHAGGTN